MVINFPGLTFVLQSYNPIMLQAAGSYFRENACCVCLRFDEMQKSRNKSAVRFYRPRPGDYSVRMSGDFCDFTIGDWRTASISFSRVTTRSFQSLSFLIFFIPSPVSCINYSISRLSLSSLHDFFCFHPPSFLYFSILLIYKNFYLCYNYVSSWPGSCSLGLLS